MSEPQVCQGGPTLIFACSGAADVGHVADLAARRLMTEGAGRMFCLVGVGGRVKPIMETTAAASRILVIDGCGLDCAKATLREAGFERFDHLRVTDLGLEKGKSPAEEQAVGRVVRRGQEILA